MSRKPAKIYDYTKLLTDGSQITSNAKTQNNSDQWTRITELTEGMPDATPGIKYVSPVIELGDSYKYIRFVIKNTALAGQESYRTFANPEIIGITWNVAEWQLFQGLDPSRVQYNFNPEVKAAVDAMKVLVDRNYR